MALNVDRLLSIGRGVARLARRVQRPPASRHRGGGRGSSGTGAVTDYPGDFHGRAQVAYSHHLLAAQLTSRDRTNVASRELRHRNGWS
ncbi:hypothetical protein [Citricoccus sp.]|uniref:hypothetical protein n=1 Tax=Citricoccus sp. TaxID=1978372 RepID=UPI0028BEDAE2|nr:hypothetical protein [Citricoccus sp.]